MKQEVILILSIGLLIISCISDRKTGVPYISESIIASKENKSFINRYSFEYEKLQIPKELLIQEVWTEREWEYKDQKGSLNYTGNTNFIVKFKNDSFQERLGIFDFLVSEKKGKMKIPFGGGGISAGKLSYDVTNNKKELDSFKLYFIYKRDTIPIFFIKK